MAHPDPPKHATHEYMPPTGCPIIGYSGIMLPVQEDPGLALHADQGHYTVTELLASSAVCGVGIDTLPCPGPSDDEKANEELRHAIARTLMDVATLAHRLQVRIHIYCTTDTCMHVCLLRRNSYSILLSL